MLWRALAARCRPPPRGSSRWRRVSARRRPIWCRPPRNGSACRNCSTRNARATAATVSGPAGCKSASPHSTSRWRPTQASSSARTRDFLRPSPNATPSRLVSSRRNASFRRGPRRPAHKGPHRPHYSRIAPLPHHEFPATVESLRPQRRRTAVRPRRRRQNARQSSDASGRRRRGASWPRAARAGHARLARHGGDGESARGGACSPAPER